MSEAPKPLPLCEALLKAAKGMRLEPSETATRADNAYRDGHNAGLAEMEAEISKRFAALSIDDVHKAMEGENSCSCPSCTGKAQAVMKLLRKEPA